MDMRINKYLAQAHIASRREADKLIIAKRVTINGVTAEIGSRVSETDHVCLDGKEISLSRRWTVVAFYKPEGVVCTRRDEHAKKTIYDVFHYPVLLNYAGRLDSNSEGLMIMTDDGMLIDAMMRAKMGHEKEYIVTIKGEVSKDFIKKMSEGIFLEELEQKTRPCFAEKLSEHSFRIILTQGLNRQIRRMCKSLGEEVTELKRVRIVNIRLGKLKPGEYREIEGEERKKLYEMVGLKDE